MLECIKENKEFYPTPKALAEKLCDIIEETDQFILEPSAGKGDLVDAINRKLASFESYRWYGMVANIDVCESDPMLRDCLAGKYSEKKKEELSERISGFRNLKEEKSLYDSLCEEQCRLNCSIVRIVEGDFLSYHTRRMYDAIVMNPPFNCGDKHLLHALELVESGGGKIACILNKETISNPYTNTRKILIQKLSELGAEISFSAMEFMVDGCERKSEVEIAVIKVRVERSKETYRSVILEGLDRAKEADLHDHDAEISDVKDLSTATTWIDALVEQCNYEIDAGIAFWKEYQALDARIMSAEDPKQSAGCLLNLNDKNGKSFNPNTYIHSVREKFWSAFFNNENFTRALTSNLQSTFRDLVKEASEYEFSKFNTQQILNKMARLMMQGREDTILSLFDTLSAKHSWLPECGNNIHYYNGWKTNQAHKINDKKVILPINGFYSYSWKSDELDEYTIYKRLSDIEKVFDYLEVGSHVERAKSSLEQIIKLAVACDQTKNIQCNYFTVTFYKKGTCHIKFHADTRELIEKLNILGSQKKGWLPPCYGFKTYSEMETDERAVIDAFQGRLAYEKVCNNADFYLGEGDATDFTTVFLPAVG